MYIFFSKVHMESIDLAKIIPRKKTLQALSMIMLLSFSSAIVSGFNLENRITMASQQTQKTKEFTLIAEETTLNISPSKRINAWTYNGTIPGPTIRVTEGDKVVVHFINNLKISYTVHFHGGHNGTVDGVFEIVPPNQTFTYEFITTPAGALMYHCHVMPVVEHVRMGLYGAFIMDPKVPLPPAKEFLLVFGDYDSTNILTNDPESTVFQWI